MNDLLSICMVIILLLFILLIYYINLNSCNDDIDISQYNISAKKQIDNIDKYNIKNYDVINDNIIIHSKYKNELLNLKKYKKMIEDRDYNQKTQQLEQRNKEIKQNSEKLKILELQQKIENLKLNIKSLKLSLKIELTEFLNDYNRGKITSDEIKIIIMNLYKELKQNKKLLYINTEINKENNKENNKEISILYDEYNKLLIIKSTIIEKKINIFTKFLK